MPRLTPLGIALKWVVAPLALAVAGFFLIGPQLGDDALQKLKVPEKIDSLLHGGDKQKGPSVDVSVSRSDQR